MELTEAQIAEIKTVAAKEAREATTRELSPQLTEHKTAAERHLARVKELEAKLPTDELAKDAVAKVTAAEKRADEAKELAKSERAKRFGLVARNAATVQFAGVKLAIDNPGQRNYLISELASKLVVEEDGDGHKISFVDGATKADFDEKYFEKYKEKHLLDFLAVEGGSGHPGKGGAKGSVDTTGMTAIEMIALGLKQKK